jgi:AraC-like DNA-binding protein
MTIFTLDSDLANISEIAVMALAEEGFASDHVLLSGGCTRLLSVPETVMPVAVIHLGDIPGAPAPDWVRRFLAKRPDFAVIAYISDPIRTPEMVTELIQLGGWCFFEWKATALAKILRRIGNSALPCRLIAPIMASTPPAVRPVLWDIVQATRRPLPVRDLEKRYGISERTLRRRFGKAGLPSPNDLLVLCRLALSVQLLSTTNWSISRVLTQLQFPSRTLFNNQMRYYIGVSPKEVRDSLGRRRFEQQFLKRFVREHEITVREHGRSS